MKKIGISILEFQRQFGDFRALEIAKEIGADAVDFSLDNKDYDYRNEKSIYSKSDEEIIEHFSKIKVYAQKVGIEICQTHGKGAGFKNVKDEDDALVENIRRDCLATSVLGAPVCVIHNTTTIFLGPDAEPALMHKLSFDMFTRILPYAKQYNIKIATETFGDAVKYNSVDFFGNIDEFMKAYNAIKQIAEYKDYFTTCVDTGHSNKAMRFGNPRPGDVIRRIGSDISVLHLNDNDTLTDQHKIPKTGTIDWDDVFNALAEVGYDGVYNMELELRHFGENFVVEEAAFGIKVLRNLLNNRNSK